MTPDYTYGHTVTKSVNDYLSKNGGWTMVTNQVSKLGTQDFSQFLTNIANSGAEFIINVNWGRDAVLSIQQAKQFGLTPNMKMVIPYQIPFLAKEVGRRSSPKASTPPPISGGRWRTNSAGQDVRRGLRQEVRLQARVGRQQRLHAIRHVGAHGLRGRHFYPPDVIKQYEKGETFPSTVATCTSAPPITNWSVLSSSFEARRRRT